MYLICKTTYPRRKARRFGETRSACPRLRVFVGVTRDQHRYLASARLPMLEAVADDLLGRCEEKLLSMTDIGSDERRGLLGSLTMRLIGLLAEAEREKGSA